MNYGKSPKSPAPAPAAQTTPTAARAPASATPSAARRAGGAVRAKGKPKAKTMSARAACEARKPGGQLDVRDDDPGAQVLGQEIGGQWNWNSTTGACQSALAFTLATVGQSAGECTTVGYASDNPGWNPDKIPAAPLRNIAGEAGPGC